MPKPVRRVALGITGSIAAFKAPALVRALVKKGAEVRCVLTPNGGAFHDAADAWRRCRAIRSRRNLHDPALWEMAHSVPGELGRPGPDRARDGRHHRAAGARARGRASNTMEPGAGGKKRTNCGAEVADALELEAVPGLGAGERGLELGVGEDLERVGIEIVEEVAALGEVVGIGLGEELVVEADFGGDGVGGRDPVHGGLDLAAVGRVAAAAGRIVGAVHLDDVAGRVFHHALRGDEVGVAQADFLAGREAVVLGRRNFAEVVLLDVELAREGHLARAGGGVFGVVRDLDELANPIWACGIVVDDQLERAQDGHGAAGAAVEVVALEVLEHFNVGAAVGARGADRRRRRRGWPRA